MTPFVRKGPASPGRKNDFPRCSHEVELMEGRLQKVRVLNHFLRQSEVIRGLSLPPIHHQAWDVHFLITPFYVDYDDGGWDDDCDDNCGAVQASRCQTMGPPLSDWTRPPHPSCFLVSTSIDHRHHPNSIIWMMIPWKLQWNDQDYYNDKMFLTIS